ncbi:hypothetical protein ACHQM5_001199 [Ranunculus cassubicifolius]
MQRGRGGRDDFFGGFSDPFGGHRSLASSLFNGRDPFDDPFFANPFGNMFGSSMLAGGGHQNMFGQMPSLFGESPQMMGGFIDNRSNRENSRPNNGVVIEEISSDEDEEHEKGVNEKKENPRKHSRSGGEPYVEEPGDARRIRHMQSRNDFNRASVTQPQNRSFSFQSSTVTYGGTNGAYYTSSTTRKMGDNGVMIEEKKEADTTTGKAEHRISKGIHDKGHTLTRKLNADGKVDTMQTLHNLNQDELAGFEETWKGNAKKHLPGWTERNNMHDDIGSSSSMHGSRQGWALPSTEQPNGPNNKARPSQWKA